MPEQITFVEHASDVVAKAATLIQQDRRFALITSVEIRGGAAREVGSLALVEDTGAMLGYLSNGCIDRDIQLHAVDTLQTGKKQLLRYGNGSQFADLKLPCGGSLSVLIDPNPDKSALLAAQQSFTARKPATLSFDVPGDAQQPVAFTYLPQFRLAIAGRGAVFRAMAQVGVSGGLQLFALSPDEEDLDAVRPLLHGAPVHLISPDRQTRLDMLDDYSAFLTLFHDHDWEPALLRAALGTKAPFIGSLGSFRTHQIRLQSLSESGVSERELARLRGPIGLVPSLREAPLIAVSAMAEIIEALPVSIRSSDRVKDGAQTFV